MAEQNAINKQTEDLIINSSAADSYIPFQIGGTDEFVFGVDDDDADKLKLNQGGASPSAGTETWVMDTSGQRLMTLQPAFNAYNSTTDTNQTGNGTTVTVEFDTEVFDQNGDYDNATDTFTAPITGQYSLNTQLIISNIGAGSRFFLTIVTSNRTYRKITGANKNPSNNATKDFYALADMDAADTAYVQLMITGNGADTIGILGSATMYTYFHGCLEC